MTMRQGWTSGLVHLALASAATEGCAVSAGDAGTAGVADETTAGDSSGSTPPGVGTDASTGATTTSSPAEDSGDASSDSAAIAFDVGGTIDPPPGLDCGLDVGHRIYLADADAAAIHILDAKAFMEARLDDPSADAADFVELAGIPDCDGFFAMTIDRQGGIWMSRNAWGVNQLAYVDPHEFSCEPVNWDVQKYPPSSLAFVGDPLTGPLDERLHVTLQTNSDNGYFSLARSQALSSEDIVIATAPLPFAALYPVPDLSGNAEGRLFGLWLGYDAAYFAEIEADTAEVLHFDQDFGPVGSPWALANWGGLAWVFTPSTSDASRAMFKPLDGGPVEVASEDLGVKVVGAAVSTCAPVVPPG